jgi:hypothetical protein
MSNRPKVDSAHSADGGEAADLAAIGARLGGVPTQQPKLKGGGTSGGSRSDRELRAGAIERATDALAADRPSRVRLYVVMSPTEAVARVRSEPVGAALEAME